MKKRIFVIRTAPYDYLIPGKNLYQSFNAVAKKETEVAVKNKIKQNFETNVPQDVLIVKSVYCSLRQRSIQTACLISAKPKILAELVEIDFCMEDFISEKDFYNSQGNPNVKRARRKFVRAFITNKLQEKYREVFNRIEDLLKEISLDISEEIVIFSHGFFMKIIEAYIRDKSIKNNPRKLLKYFDGNTETFKFCEGFILDSYNGKFKFQSYIRNKGLIK